MKGRGVRIDLLLINLAALKEGGGFLQQISLVYIFLLARPPWPVVHDFLDSVALLPTSRPPTREQHFGAHFLMLRSHKSSMFQKPVIWGPWGLVLPDPQITGL